MPPTVRIGKKKLLHSGLLVLDDDETAHIEIPLPLGASISTDVVKIEFMCPSTASAATTFGWKTVGDVVKFELSGFKSNLWGVVLPKPQPFGVQNGQPLFLEFVYTRVSERNVVQFMVLQQEP
jgi:hypothetical protein